ncbi:hypothetical protein BH09VER1_BH09VER1_41850 [soil metagenome]
MKKILFLIAAAAVAGSNSVHAADQFFSGSGVALDSASYGATSAGPFTSSFTNGNTLNFSATNGTGTGGTITAVGVNATQNFTITAPAGVLSVSGTVNVSPTMTLDFGTQTIDGTAGFTKAGTGTFVLAGSSTISGTANILGGIVRATSSTSALGTSVINFGAAGATLQLANDTGLNFGRNVNDNSVGASATIVADRLTAGAGVTYTMGTLTIASATMTVQAGSNVTSGTAGVSFSGNTGLAGAAPVFDVQSGALLTLSTVTSGNPSALRIIKTVGAGDMVITGIVNTGSGGVNQAGTGQMTLSGANLFTGSATVTAGILRATSSANALGLGALALAGGTLELANDTALNFGRNTTVSGNVTVTSDRLTAGAGVTQSLGTLSIGSRILTVAAGSNVTSGTAGLSFGAVTLAGTAPVFAPQAGTLLTLASVTGARGFTVNGAGDATITGIISTGTGDVAKSGSGQLTLSGSNTYTGGTTLNAGTLLLTDASSAGTSGVTLNGGTLKVNVSSGTGAIGNAVTFSGTAASYTLERAAGASFTAYAAGSQLSGGINTNASFLDGTASVAETMTSSFTNISTASNDASRLSDVFNLNGTLTDKFVMQLTVSGLDNAAIIGWLSGGSWVNAVAGNDASGIYAGFYSMSYAAFVASHGGTFDGTTMLGAYGNDGSGNAWAVLDHNSDFAAIPEPQTWALLGFGGLVLVWRARRRTFQA